MKNIESEIEAVQIPALELALTFCTCNTSVHMNMLSVSGGSRSRCCTRALATKSWLGVTLKPCHKTDINSPFHPTLETPPPAPPPPSPSCQPPRRHPRHWSNNRRHAFNSLNKQTSTREEEGRPRQFFHLSV